MAAGDSTMPPDPITSLAEGAAQTHELYLAYLKAGFRRREALELLKAIVAAGIRANIEAGDSGGQS